MNERKDYDYDLPRDLIAQQPLRNRTDARLLVVDRSAGRIEDAHVRDLPDLLRPADCLVLNDTRVIPARLVGVRERTGGRWEGLFLDADEHGLWRLPGKTRGKLVAGESIRLRDRAGEPALRLGMVAALGGGEWVAAPEDEGDALEWVERVGHVPLPPYIRGGKMTDEDIVRYQTVYAERRGAVAAPTAGLHFTRELLTRLEARRIATARVTLHVGVGTFRTIATERLDDHVMHAEWGELGSEAIRIMTDARQRGGRVIAVGTTVVRVLETAAEGGRPAPWSGRTDLFIRPPYRFRAVEGLMTNFHLPQSTLLVLVRTFGGDALIRGAYAHAIADRYRFFSYGDAMIIV